MLHGLAQLRRHRCLLSQGRLTHLLAVKTQSGNFLFELMDTTFQLDSILGRNFRPGWTVRRQRISLTHLRAVVLLWNTFLIRASNASGKQISFCSAIAMQAGIVKLCASTMPQQPTMRIGPNITSPSQPFSRLLALLLAILPLMASLAELPEKRQPWVTSRIIGNAEAPPPYRAERTFTKFHFRNPVELVPMPGTNLWFLVEQRGPIYSFPFDGQTTSTNVVIDLKRDLPGFHEAYGLAFHPQFAKNRKIYLCYINKPDVDDNTHVSEFTLPDAQPLRIDPKSEHIIITWRSGGHNGGSIKFGPDGMLYMSAGDGGPASPPDLYKTGQNMGDLMSAISRIDVDHPANGKLYSVPKDNPFLNTPGARPELWCYGLRNPWRMSFDASTGSLWLGDVGWEIWEMVYKIQRGANYGWSVWEGPQLIHPNEPLGPTPVSAPTYAHSHSEARSITGGFVYRGKQYPDLVGSYVYGDWVTGKIWALREQKNGKPLVREIANTAQAIICFGEDHNRELLVVSYDGGIFELKPNKATAVATNFPRKLSDTGLFRSTAKNELAEGVLPYDTNVEMWSDGAGAERFIALPGNSTISKFAKGDFSKGETQGAWKFPTNTVFAKTIYIEQERGNSTSRRRLETQLLHYTGDDWKAYSYHWNRDQNDAVLFDGEGREETYQVKTSASGKPEAWTWRYSNRTECMVCHLTRTGTIHSFASFQLDKPATSNGKSANQLELLKKLGIFEHPIPQYQRMASLADEQASVNDRARAYLHVNCSHCHRFGGSGASTIDFRWEMANDKMLAIDVAPTQGTFGLDNPHVITPGRPQESVLLYRFAKLGRGHMPYLGAQEVDGNALKLLERWVHGLPSTNSSAAKLDISTKLETTSQALAAICALEETPEKWSMQEREAFIQQGLASTRPEIHELFERFLPSNRRSKTLGTNIRPKDILSLKGNAERGRSVFFNTTGMQCTQCHQVQGAGRSFGPELSKIGLKYDRAKLLENIWNPPRILIRPSRVT